MRTAFTVFTLTALIGAAVHGLPTTLELTDHYVQQSEGPILEAATQNITAGPNYTVGAGADVTFAAGQQIVLRSGFAVQQGATFRVNSRLMIDLEFEGDMQIEGNAYVAGYLTVSGGQLTLSEGARMVFLAGEDSVLNVEGTLIANGARFTTDGTTAGSWIGLRINGGSAILTGCTIERARQGVALSGASPAVTLEGCDLLGNLVGVHQLSGLLYMDDNLFQDNEWYAVKIDAGLAQATDNRFEQNGNIYYHPQLTLLSVQELNTIEGNWGNVEQ